MQRGRRYPRMRRAPSCKQMTSNHVWKDGDIRGRDPWRRFLGAVAVLCFATLSQTSLGLPAFKDPLDNPARTVDRLDKRPLQAVTQAGERLVAVGSRGLIVLSTDGGTTWKQARVPVQSDLLAVHFSNPETGWAVGHGGVVLRTDDSGDSWIKQLDGRTSGEAFLNYYRPRADAGDTPAKEALKQLEQNFRVPGALPYLDVWFKDANEGFAVGSFGMLIATTDGGKTWTPWLDRIDNKQFVNLNCIREIGGEVYIAGERGQVFKLDRSKGRFLATPTGYAGSFFGIAGNSRTILIFGLRGVAYRSGDRGSTWEAVRMPSEATISAGIVRSDDSQAFILVNIAGQILTADADAREFRLHQPPEHLRLTGVVALSRDSLLVTAQSGVAVEGLPRTDK
jgi:photosystem II stability/assembly factor-like uncharacterized protein